MFGVIHSREIKEKQQRRKSSLNLYSRRNGLERRERSARIGEMYAAIIKLSNENVFGSVLDDR